MATGRKFAALLFLCFALLLACVPACEAGGWKGKGGGRPWASRRLLKPWEGKKKATRGGGGRWGSSVSWKRKKGKKPKSKVKKPALRPSPAAVVEATAKNPINVDTPFGDTSRVLQRDGPQFSLNYRSRGRSREFLRVPYGLPPGDYQTRFLGGVAPGRDNYRPRGRYR